MLDGWGEVRGGGFGELAKGGGGLLEADEVAGAGLGALIGSSSRGE